jgi:methionyl-tRNA formyltransferase
MRIAFFGTPDFAVPSLLALLQGEDPVIGVVCQPDKPAGRGQRLTPPPVKVLAERAGIPVLQPQRLREATVVEALRAWRPDLIVVAAYGKLLPSSILELPRHGCINVHASLLPRYRGAAPIQWAILNGDAVTGVTIMQMNAEMDAGDILLQRETAIQPDETYGALQIRLANAGAELLIEAIARLHAGTLEARRQRDDEATMAPMIKKDHGRLDWGEPAALLARKVRAFNPWPSAFTFLDGKRLRVHRAHAATAASAAPPGTVVGTAPAIVVAAAEGVLLLEEVQLEGRKALSAAEFARGSHLEVGTVLG